LKIWLIRGVWGVTGGGFTAHDPLSLIILTLGFEQLNQFRTPAGGFLFIARLRGFPLQGDSFPDRTIYEM